MGMFNVTQVPSDPLLQKDAGQTQMKLSFGWLRWFVQLQQVLTSNNPITFPTYTLTTLPSAAANTGKFIYVSNATTVPKLCYSNGTNWCLVNTATVVS